MHILIIPSTYPTYEFPLSSIFYKEQALAVKEYGNKVGVIFSETRRISKISYSTIKRNHFQVSNYNEEGVSTYRLHGWNVFTMRGMLGVNLWVRQSIKLFEKYINEQGKPDIIHVHSALYGGLVAVEIRKKYNIPFVITEHSSSILQGGLRYHDIPILQKVYKNADYIISVGGALKNSIQKYCDKNVEVIPNIVDINRFSIGSHNKNSEEFTFISVCNLKESKNVRLTIEAFKEILRVNKNIRLIIVGDGPEKMNLIKLSRSIKHKIDFVGAVSREKLNEYINKADAFVLPSKFETFGIAYIEALACGIPIIATKCGGPEDFFNEKIGYMIPIDNLCELITAMINIIENNNKFNRSYIREYAERRFSNKVVSEKIINVYNKVLNGNGDIDE